MVQRDQERGRAVLAETVEGRADWVAINHVPAIWEVINQLYVKQPAHTIHLKLVDDRKHQLTRHRWGSAYPS